MKSELFFDDNFRQEFMEGMLLPGENIVHIATISSGIYWKGIAVMIVALFALLFGFWLALYCAAVGALLLLVAYSTKKYLVLAVTDHRIIIRAGIFNQEVLQLRYPQIESIDVLYTLPGMIFGYGSVVITGTGRARWMIPFIEDAADFRDSLMQKLLESEKPLEQRAA